jgi:PRTRC genetic system protein C
MAVKVETIARQFKYKDLLLPDPNPAWPESKVIDFYKPQYPEFSNTTVKKETKYIEFDGKKQDVQINTIKPAFGTNG